MISNIHFSPIAIHWFIYCYFKTLSFFLVCKIMGGGGQLPPAPMFLRPCTSGIYKKSTSWLPYLLMNTNNTKDHKRSSDVIGPYPRSSFYNR